MSSQLDALVYQPIQYGIVDRVNADLYDWRSNLLIDDDPSVSSSQPIAANGGGGTEIERTPSGTSTRSARTSSAKLRRERVAESGPAVFPELTEQQMPPEGSFTYATIDEAGASHRRALDNALNFLRKARVTESTPFSPYDRLLVQEALDKYIEAIDAYRSRRDELRAARDTGGFDALRRLHRARTSDEQNVYLPSDRVYHDLFEDLNDLRMKVAQRQQMLHELIGVSSVTNVDTEEGMEKLVERSQIVGMAELVMGLADDGRGRDIILEQLADQSHAERLFERYRSVRLPATDQQRARQRFMQENPFRNRSIDKSGADPLDDQGVASDQRIFESMQSIEILKASRYANALVLGGNNWILKYMLFLLVDSDSQREKLFRQVLSYGIARNGWTEEFEELNAVILSDEQNLAKEAFKAAGGKTKSEELRELLKKLSSTSSTGDAITLLEQLMHVGANGAESEQRTFSQMLKYLMYSLIVFVIMGSLGGGALMAGAFSDARKFFDYQVTSHADDINWIGAQAKGKAALQNATFTSLKHIEEMDIWLARFGQYGTIDKVPRAVFQAMTRTIDHGRGMLVASARFIEDTRVLVEVIDGDEFEVERLNDLPTVDLLQEEDKVQIKRFMREQASVVRRSSGRREAIELLRSNIDRLTVVFRRSTSGLTPGEFLSGDVDMLIEQKNIVVEMDLPIYGVFEALRMSDSIRVVTRMQEAAKVYGALFRRDVAEMAALVDSVRSTLLLGLIESEDIDSEDRVKHIQSLISDNSRKFKERVIPSSPQQVQASRFVSTEIDIRRGRSREQVNMMMQQSGQRLPWPMLLDQSLNASDVEIDAVLVQSWFWLTQIGAISLNVALFTLLQVSGVFALHRVRRESSSDRHSLTASLTRYIDRVTNFSFTLFGPQGFVSTTQLLMGLVPLEMGMHQYYFALGEQTQISIMVSSFARMSSVWLLINVASSQSSQGITSFYLTDMLTNRTASQLYSLTGLTLGGSSLQSLIRLGGNGILMRYLPISSITQSLIDLTSKKIAPKSLQPQVSAYSALIYRSMSNMFLVEKVIDYIPTLYEATNINKSRIGGFANPISLQRLLLSRGLPGSYDLLTKSPAFFIEGVQNFAILLGINFDGDQTTVTPRLLGTLAMMTAVFWNVKSRIHLANAEFNDSMQSPGAPIARRTRSQTPSGESK